MNAFAKWSALCTLLGLAGSAWGHHSFAMFDLEKQVTVEGTVKEFQWTNPHCWLQVTVPDGKGGQVMGPGGNAPPPKPAGE